MAKLVEQAISELIEAKQKISDIVHVDCITMDKGEIKVFLRSERDLEQIPGKAVWGDNSDPKQFIEVKKEFMGVTFIAYVARGEVA